MSGTTTTNPLADELRAAVAAIDGVKLVDSKSGRYYTVKLGTKTLGYVNVGTKRMRVDLPQRGDERPRFVVEKRSQIARAVKLLSSYAPAPVSAAKSTKSKTSASRRAG